MSIALPANRSRPSCRRTKISCCCGRSFKLHDAGDFRPKRTQRVHWMPSASSPRPRRGTQVLWNTRLGSHSAMRNRRSPPPGPAAGIRPLVANRAIERMVDQQKFHPFLRRHRLLGIRPHLHAFGHRRGTGRSGRLRPDQAHPAIGGDRQLLVITEVRHVDAERMRDAITDVPARPATACRRSRCSAAGASGIGRHQPVLVIDVMLEFVAEP